jgi:hypothetical protein
MVEFWFENSKCLNARSEECRKSLGGLASLRLDLVEKGASLGWLRWVACGKKCSSLTEERFAKQVLPTSLVDVFDTARLPIDC